MQPVLTQDFRHCPRSQVHDVLGRLRRVIDPSPGGTASHDFDAFGNLNRVQDPIGAVSTGSYNLRGFRTQWADVEGVRRQERHASLRIEDSQWIPRTMIENVKAVDSLTVADLKTFAVWQYTNREGADETYVRPVKRAQVASLTGKVVGTQVTLANGERVWALIGNVDPSNPRMTEHFLTLSVERDGRWFTLARYHNFDIAEYGPDALAKFLGLARRRGLSNQLRHSLGCQRR